MHELAWCFLFFFQAEDGIRDLVRSRGLGDVYKRQGGLAAQVLEEFALDAAELVDDLDHVHRDADGAGPVSYTHLTLPTSDLV